MTAKHPKNHAFQASFFHTLRGKNIFLSTTNHMYQFYTITILQGRRTILASGYHLEIPFNRDHALLQAQFCNQLFQC